MCGPSLHTVPSKCIGTARSIPLFLLYTEINWVNDWWQKHCEFVKPHKTSVSDITSNQQRAGVTVSHSTEQSCNTEAIPPDASHSFLVRIGRLQFAKNYRDEPQKFWNKVLWTDENKINQSGNAKVWRKNTSTQDPKHTSSSVKHGGEVSWLGLAWLLLEWAH